MQERFSGDSETAYNCNLELVGEEPQDTYQGAYSQDGPAYYDVCAYYGTDSGPTTGQGIKVIDASDPQHPVVTANLTDTPAALAPHETVPTNANTRLLVAGQTNGPNFAVYDISDCRHPVLKGQHQRVRQQLSTNGQLRPGRQDVLCSPELSRRRRLPVHLGPLRPGQSAGAPALAIPGRWQAPLAKSQPEWLLPGVPEGTLMYAGQPGEFGMAPTDSSFGPDGLVIEDVSDYQFRRPNPQIRIISKLFWADQGTIRVDDPREDQRAPVHHQHRRGGRRGRRGRLGRPRVPGGRPLSVIRRSSTSPTRRTRRSSPSSGWK